MASKPINWNIVIIGGAVVAGLYLFNKLQKPTARNYESGVTDSLISEASQPTIRTDLRQSARTQRVGLRTERVGIRQSERTVRAIGRQDVRINRQDERTARAIGRQDTRVLKTQIRQSERTNRVQIRTQARQQLRSNVVKSVSNVASIAKAKISSIKTKIKGKR